MAASALLRTNTAIIADLLQVRDAGFADNYAYK